MIRVAEGLAARGVHVVTFNFPYKDAGRKVPDPPRVLEETWRHVWADAVRAAKGPAFAGGKSMGGRIASQVAARDEFAPRPAGLVYFGYPLHPPHLPKVRRDTHLKNIAAPLLFLQGTRDPFGSPDEMRALVAGLPAATLELIEDGDHSLMTGKKKDPAGRLLERAVDAAAEWIKGHT